MAWAIRSGRMRIEGMAQYLNEFRGDNFTSLDKYSKQRYIIALMGGEVRRLAFYFNESCFQNKLVVNPDPVPVSYLAVYKKSHVFSLKSRSLPPFPLLPSPEDDCLNRDARILRRHTHCWLLCNDKRNIDLLSVFVCSKYFCCWIDVWVTSPREHSFRTIQNNYRANMRITCSAKTSRKFIKFGGSMLLSMRQIWFCRF